MDLGLKGKRALVLSSSRGLGRGIAEALAAEGADVLLTARTAERLDEAVAAINARGQGRAYAFAGSLKENVEAIHAAAQEHLGGVDILVANTGGPPAATALTVQPEAWDAPVRGDGDPGLPPRRAGPAGDAPGRLRPHPGRRVERRRAADPEPGDVERAARLDRRLGQDARLRGRGRRRHRQHDPARPDRDRPHGRARHRQRQGAGQVARRDRRGRPRGDFRPSATARCRNSPTWPASSPPSAPPTSPAA